MSHCRRVTLYSQFVPTTIRRAGFARQSRNERLRRSRASQYGLASRPLQSRARGGWNPPYPSEFVGRVPPAGIPFPNPTRYLLHIPNYVRWREQGATYFFTVVTYLRRRLFNDATARQALRRAFVEIRRKWPFDMFACVLLPDHFHCIWTLPASDDRFPLRWANIKRRFTQVYMAGGGAALAVSSNRERRHERGVWQQRYWEHRIRDENELYAYRDYIHLNPVKHGYVRDPTEWPWSSVHRQLRLGWLSKDWSGWTPISVDVAGE